MHTLTSLFPLRRMRRAMLREKIFAHCAPCHSTKPGENKLELSLAGVFGRKGGTEPGYTYSWAPEGAERDLG